MSRYLEAGNVGYKRAMIAAALGERERATELLIDFSAEWFHMAHDWAHDPRFEPLRDYPPFQELIRPKG